MHKNEEEAREYRPPKLSRYEQATLEVQMRKVAGSWPVSESCSVLQPDFKGQRNRLMVPCVGTSEYVWVRARSVITLGELFVQLHHKYTARHIYYLCLHLEIVGVKRKKVPPRKEAKNEKRMEQTEAMARRRLTAMRECTD